MAETEVWGGFEYTREGPGQPWRKSRPVGPQPIEVAQGNPYGAPQAAANVNKTQTDIVDTQADNRRDDLKLEAELRAKGMRIGANGSIEDIPNWKPPEHLKPAAVIDEENKNRGKAQKGEVVRNIMKRTIDLYKSNIKGQPPSRLWGLTERFDGGEDGRDLIKSPQAEEFTRTAEGMLALIRPMVAMGAKDGDSNTELLIFKSYIPAAGDSDITIESKLRNLEILLNGVAQGKAASEVAASGLNSGATPLVDAALSERQEDRRTPPVMGQPGFASGGAAEKSIPIPQPMQDEHTSYLAQNWERLDPSAYAEFRALLDSKYGFGPRMDAYRAIVPDLNNYAAQGGSPVGLNIPPVNAKMDGLDQINASVFNNKAGGFIFGAGDQLGVADEMAGGFNSLVKGTDYDVEVARANAMKQGMQDAYPGMNLTGNIVGALATGAGAAKAFPGLFSALTGTTKRAIGTGAAFGGASGAGEMNDSRMTGLAIGTGLGVAGGSAGAVASPIIRSAMGTQAGQAVSRAGRSAWNNTAGKITPSMQVAAAPVVPQFRKGEGLLPAEVLESAIPNLQDADRLGLPYALADADPQLRALAGSVSRRSADARQMAEDTFGPRAGDQVERATTAIETHLAPPVDIGARQQGWREVANERARPLYEEAYQGGSTAPLENQLESAFNASSRGVSEARAALQAAEREATVSSAQVSRAGNNVYQNAQALPGARNASAAIEGARQRLAQAEAQHTQVVEQLRRSQGDAAGNAPGAVWNPRLQEFIDDPLSKAGLARGLEIQRLEALAEGRPFNPTEYAVVGNDAAGNPVVGNVPNLRTLDAIKKGYDAILDDYPRDMKGNQIFDQRGRAITMAKKSLVGELDNVTGGELGPYASARNTYGTYTQLGQRLQEGYDAAPRGTYARDIQPRLGAMDDANRGEFQSGYATRLRDMVQDTNDSADPYRLIYGGSERRAKMATVFPEGHQQFGRVYDLEQDMSKTAYETMGGSPTAMRQATDQQFDSGMMGIGTDLAADAAGGGGAFTLKSMIGRSARAMGDTARIRGGKAKADAIAPVLYAPDPRMTLDYLADLQARQAQAASRAGAYRRRGGLFGAILPSGFLGSE